MPKQIPRGDENLVCPLHKKTMDLVCHKCPWWQSVRGQNPNTGEEIDRWDCAIALLPLMTIEVANQARQGAAATESFRNEMVRLSRTHDHGDQPVDRERQLLQHLNDRARRAGASAEPVKHLGKPG